MYVGGTESQSTKLNYAKMQLYFLYMTWLSFSNFPFPLLAETWIWHFWVKINQVRVFVTLILRVAVKFQAQRKSKDCVVLSIRTWEMTVIIVSSVCTDIYWSVLDHSSHWSAPVSHCRVQNPTQPVWPLASHALQCHRHISQAALFSFQWEAPSHPGASFSSSSGPVRKYVGKV